MNWRGFWSKSRFLHHCVNMDSVIFLTFSVKKSLQSLFIRRRFTFVQECRESTRSSQKCSELKSISPPHTAFNSVCLSSCSAVERKLDKWQASTGLVIFWLSRFFKKKSRFSSLLLCDSLFKFSVRKLLFLGCHETFSLSAVELNLFHLGPNFVVFAAVVHRINSLWRCKAKSNTKIYITSLNK